MFLRLIREPSRDHATMGVLFVNDVFQCFMLEDVVREREGQPVSAWKIPGATAIPAGLYRVRLTPSRRFLRVLPELIDVPGFTGVRIHPGNTAEDTEGCLLPGADRQDGRVLRSRVAFEALFERLTRATLPIWIHIFNVPPRPTLPADPGTHAA